MAFRERIVLGGEENSFPIIIKLFFQLFQTYEYRVGAITHMHDDEVFANKDNQIYTGINKILFNILLQFGMSPTITTYDDKGEEKATVLTSDNLVEHNSDLKFDLYKFGDDSICTQLLKQFSISKQVEFNQFCRTQLVELHNLINNLILDEDHGLEPLMNHLLSNIRRIQQCLVDDNLQSNNSNKYVPVRLDMAFRRTENIMMFAINVLNELCTHNKFVYSILQTTSKAFNSLLLDLSFFIRPYLYSSTIDGNSIGRGTSNNDVYNGMVPDVYSICINFGYRIFGFEPNVGNPVGAEYGDELTNADKAVVKHDDVDTMDGPAAQSFDEERVVPNSKTSGKRRVAKVRGKRNFSTFSDNAIVINRAINDLIQISKMFTSDNGSLEPSNLNRNSIFYG
jgi:hypothetical protein